MKLIDMLKGVKYTSDCDMNMDIQEIAFDSRKVVANSLFFCISGFKVDGHDFALAAIKAGARCLVVTKKLDIDIPQIMVEDDRMAMALISSNFFGNPASAMKIVGITGTNGKTTTTYVTAQVAKRLGKKVGIIGTICNWIGDKKIETKNTTPESLDLQRLFKQMLDEKVDIVFMEISSHSLELKRVAGITFDIGVFTNLTQDHLDFHLTMQNYMKAKAKLFENSNVSIINIDDIASQFMIRGAKSKVITYGTRDNAEIKAKDIKLLPYGSEFKLCTPGSVQMINFNIPGLYNVYNALCAISVCMCLNYSMEEIKAGIKDVVGVDGRCQVLTKTDSPFTVILDYAHTPDGLENILSTFKSFAKGRLVSVFGCGGDRDDKKRSIMGGIGGKYCDFTILTSDNPRTENPTSILKQVEDGIKTLNADYIVIENRKDAIEYAIKNAMAGDIIVLAGKGHETYQEINGVRHHFDEKEIVAEIISSL